MVSIQDRTSNTPYDSNAGTGIGSLTTKPDVGSGFLGLDTPTALGLMYGPAAVTQLTRPADELRQVARQREFEDVWTGAAHRIRDVIIRMFKDSDREIFRLLPVEMMPPGGNNFVVEKYEWNSAIAEDVPVHGNMRLTQQSYHSWTTKSMRKGRGFMIVSPVAELGSQWGRMQFLNGVRQVYASGVDAMAVTAYKALLEADVQTSVTGNAQAKGQLNRRNMKTYAERARDEARDAFPLNKGPFGVNLMLREAKTALADRGNITMDTVVMPFATRDWAGVATQGTGVNAMSITGQAGFNQMREMSGFIAEPTGVRIIEAAKIPFGPDGGFEDPLEAVRQIGEMYVARVPEQGTESGDAPFATRLQSLRLLNCTADALVDIHPLKMLANSGLFTGPEGNRVMTQRGRVFFGTQPVQGGGGQSVQTVARWLSMWPTNTWLSRVCQSIVASGKAWNPAVVANGGEGAAAAAPAGGRRVVGGNLQPTTTATATNGAHRTGDAHTASGSSQIMQYYYNGGEPGPIDAAAFQAGNRELREALIPSKILEWNAQESRRLTSSEVKNVTAILKRMGPAAGNDPIASHLRILYSGNEALSSMYNMDPMVREQFRSALFANLPANARGTSGMTFHTKNATMGAHAVRYADWANRSADWMQVDAFSATLVALGTYVPGIVGAMRAEHLARGGSTENWTAVAETLKAVDFALRALQSAQASAPPAWTDLVRRIVNDFMTFTEMSRQYDLLIAMYNQSGARQAHVINTVLNTRMLASDDMIAEADAGYTVAFSSLSPESAFLESAKLDAPQKEVARALNSTPVSEAAIMELMRREVPLPINYGLWRPWNRYRVGSVIAMKSGKETGNVFVRGSTAQVYADPAHDLLHGRFAFDVAVVLQRSEAIYVRRLAMCSDYVSGGDVTFFDWDRGHEQIGMVYTGDRNAPSIICVPLYPEEMTKNQNVIDMMGRFPTDGIPVPGRVQPPTTPSFYAMAPHVVTSFGLRHPTDYMQPDRYTEATGNRVNQLNTLLLEGPHFKFDYTAKMITPVFVRGCGHFSGMKLEDNCMAHRTGKAPYRAVPDSTDTYGRPYG